MAQTPQFKNGRNHRTGNLAELVEIRAARIVESAVGRRRSLECFALKETLIFLIKDSRTGLVGPH
jgi:hypothetical protein